jgi:arsenite oxidase small subunit
MERRDFVKFCAASAAALGAPEVSAAARAQLYGKAKLVDEKGAPLRASRIPRDRNLIFHYPFAATPCFLLNLGKAVKPAQLKTVAGEAYEWTGGIGSARSVVAYSAICAHRLSYPTKEISFISYRTEKSARNRLGNVIHCCSEHSQYDPAQGARVLAGPAPQPLASIILDWDSEKDEIYAVGTLGGEMFTEFFDKFGFKLQLEHGSPRQQVAGACVVQELDNYCKQQVKC